MKATNNSDTDKIEWVLFGNDEIVNVLTGEIKPLSDIKNITLSSIDLDHNAFFNDTNTEE